MAASSPAASDPATAGPGHDRYEVQGREVQLPCHVAHAMVGIALFAADADAVAADLPAGLAPVSTRPGRTLIALQAVRYVDNPLGDYDEGVVASIVRPAADTDPVASLRDVLAGRHGVFVHHMPVTQAFTREAGERVWGFPKTLDTLDLRLAPHRAGLRWSDDDGEVLQLTVPRGGRLPAPAQVSRTFTFHDGIVWRTGLAMHGHGMRAGLGGGRLRLGRHAVADRMRRWGLGERAVATAWIEHAVMDFGPAEPLR